MSFEAIRKGISKLDPAASHSASGDGKPQVEEIFAPEQHAGALDPNVTIVLGARGAGKSFWAGVLGDDQTRRAAAEAYPHIGLDKTTARFGFTGLINDGSVSRSTIDAQVPIGEEITRGMLLWRCVVLRALISVVEGSEGLPTIGTLMKKYADPEEWEADCEALDQKIKKSGKKLVVLFDALDALAVDWERLRSLTDALLEVAWTMRSFSSVRVKLFFRPDQVRDLGLRFVEVPKLLAGSTNLKWGGPDLYGMLFTRLGTIKDPSFRKAFHALLREEGVPVNQLDLKNLRKWPLSHDSKAQARVFRRLAGNYMGRSHKKGRTYDWPIKHLADGHSEVTPRSFMTLMIEAARFEKNVVDQAITAEGIRHGLREASKTRVNQLELEFKWIKRALAPLARLQVPCTFESIRDRWRETKTIPAIRQQAEEREFLSPFDPNTRVDRYEQLIKRFIAIGVLIIREDGRFDMPDLFRVAARLLKRGGVAPT